MKNRRKNVPVKTRKFKNLSLKTEFCDGVKTFITQYPQYGYRSIAQFLEDASRRRLEELKLRETEEPRFTKLNFDENGVKIWDARLHKTADVYFKPNGIHCILDNASNCEHVYFALTFTEVRDLVRAKRKEGWKLPDL